MKHQMVVKDGNEAAAFVAYHTNEVIAIYPITPASPMGEHADAWAASGCANIFGNVPRVIEMQSEAGAAGAVHGSLQCGALTTTFTASQGLLLMIPNMFKIAGELTPAVIHVAARSVATHALSIFGDHSDVMAVRTTGWAMLAASSVQEAQDFALISQSATLLSRVPFLHFFDGFRTSHEVSKIERLSLDDIRALIDENSLRGHRDRGLTPDRPVLRGTAQNPDVFFQAREAINPFYEKVGQFTQNAMDRLGEITGRSYRLFDYVGSEDADRVIVMMGSGCGAAEQAVEYLMDRGERVGLLKVRLYRPFYGDTFVQALPRTTRALSVLDRTKEPGSLGEPLYQDVVTALVESWHDIYEHDDAPRVMGGRYGLSSKEFTPSMAVAVFQELHEKKPKKHFTIGIYDDVSQLSLPWDSDLIIESRDVNRAVFYGLGSDGTVGAVKSAATIIGESPSQFVQAYFVYDSKKAGSVTVSHLRYGPKPIDATYLIQKAEFVACHQFHFLERIDVLGVAAEGGTLLLNAPYSTSEVFETLSQEVQQEIIEKKLSVWVIDAHKIAKDAGLGGRINTVMQTCFFALSRAVEAGGAILKIKESIEKSYGRRGASILSKNFAAVDLSVESLAEVQVPDKANAVRRSRPIIPESAPDFVRRVTGMMLEGKGDLLPVSALPIDGTFPVGTAQYEKRSIAREIPIWDPSICVDCGLCAISCPHAAIRMKLLEPGCLHSAPEGFPSKPWSGKGHPNSALSLQVAPDDCTGCGVCVDVCPAHSKEAVRHKAINMEPKGEHLERERVRFDFFLGIDEVDRTSVKCDSVKESQLLQPLFEFSGACAGCGETPYLKLLSQLFGDRILIANATGCSSIFGGNLPTTPWTKNKEGRGPAWANSLFEDNAEFGLGMRLALNQNQTRARESIQRFVKYLGADRIQEICHAEQVDEKSIAAQRAHIQEIKSILSILDTKEARDLESLVDSLVRKSIWIVGGDGWAYDIGFGGLDHVLASGEDVNILVLDTEVYSNTGGQASKATPRGATAKFAANGKTVPKKDLGMIAMAYGNVFVAQVAMGAQPLHTTKAFLKAESYPGPSLILAYSHCIAHGIDMASSMSHQKEAVHSGYWPLYEYDPREASKDNHPFRLLSRKPTLPLKEFAMKEARFAMLMRAKPDVSTHLLELAQQDVDERWRYYEQLAGVERSPVANDTPTAGDVEVSK